MRYCRHLGLEIVVILLVAFVELAVQDALECFEHQRYGKLGGVSEMESSRWSEALIPDPRGRLKCNTRNRHGKEALPLPPV